MKRDAKIYTEFDPYADECEVKQLTVKIVKTRKEHQCMGVPGFPETPIHQMGAGSTARYESAIVDGDFGSYYTCIACIDKYLDSERLW